MQSSMPKLLLLDVYETLLDMNAVEKQVNDLMGSKRGYTLWLERLMQYCFVDNCVIQFNPFPSIVKATLQMTAQTLERELSGTEVETVLNLMKQLPIHLGVQQGLSQLRDQNFRIGALTNVPEAIVRERMERTGLISYFENVLSAEHVGKYKPSREVYLWAASKFDLAPSEILLVSAHGWDLAGAAYAGMRTAYLEQKKQVLYPLAPEPEFVCKDLLQLSNLLAERTTSQPILLPEVV